MAECPKTASNKVLALSRGREAEHHAEQLSLVCRLTATNCRNFIRTHPHLRLTVGLLAQQGFQ